MRFRRDKTAAVLGCGPAGLFAAHALVERGWKLEIFSKKRRSEMFGAQYLHEPIPGLTDDIEPMTIDYQLIGLVDDYRQKVYGNVSPGMLVSPQVLQPTHSAWDIRRAYWNAWDLYMRSIEPVNEIGPEWVSNLIASRFFNRIVSSIPAPAICRRPEQHVFASQEVWAIGDAPERGIFCPVTEAKPFEVILNGSPDVGWYRTANVFGYRTAEWPAGRKPPFDGVSKLVKPISTDCDCFTKDITRVGRYGEWKKGVLSHTAYTRAVER